MSISDRKILKIMGKKQAGEFFKAREEHYDRWRAEQFGNKNFCFEKLNSLVKETGQIVGIHSERFSLRIDREVEVRRKVVNVKDVENRMSTREKKKEEVMLIKGEISRIIIAV